MENPAPSPLNRYFRQPAIYLKLPSQGRWWSENALNLPANGEIGVMPMTARDEITLRTPDALLNGQGVVEVVQSCCPSIRDAWKMPSVDLDAVLISIRIATYGNKMPFDSRCPHCQEDNTHDLDLGQQLANLHCPDFGQILDFETLKIRLRPQQYFEANKNNIVNFEEQKILQALENTDLDPDIRAAQVHQSMNNIIEAGIRSCAASTEYIETPEGERVRNSEHITEFYKNASNSVIKTIQDRLAELVETSKLPRLHLQCGSCKAEYDTEMTFDYSNFFVKGF